MPLLMNNVLLINEAACSCVHECVCMCLWEPSFEKGLANAALLFYLWGLRVFVSMLW